MFQQQVQPEVDYERLRLAQSEQVRKHYQSREVGVILPALQSAVTALAVSGLVSIIWVRFKLPYAFESVLGVFFLAFLAVWFSRLSNWNKLIWTLENALNADFSGDSVVGEPEPAEVLKVELHSEDNRRIQFIEFGVPKDRLRDFARGILAGAPLSERQWSGAGALFSQGEFRQLRDTLLSKGLVRYRDERYPQQGVEPSAGGRAFFRSLADSPTPTVNEHAINTQ